MSDRSTEHASFTIEREYEAAPARVFAAWADAEAKSRWFGPPRSADGPGVEMDFRVGGRERFVTAGPDGASYTYDALFMDIVAGQRIVYAYEMLRSEDRISVSVTTVELQAAGAGTKLTYTEQGVFLDGLDTSAQREHGTSELLGRLGSSLPPA
jgi:uncharacterized protein YndB with AHSA1/START domain